MSLGRPPEDEQVEMFAEITTQLREIGLEKYEISNFAKPGFESRHNLAYWNDSNYWGIGLSSHSYMSSFGDFGLRFWNPKSLDTYGKQASEKARSFVEHLPLNQYEALQAHESLTDFCHMFLRTAEGLPKEALRKKFGQGRFHQVQSRLQRLVARDLLTLQSDRYSLTSRGQLISNKVFEELTFLSSDMTASTLTDEGPNSYCSV
jgi:oxygen-independent coproporphyrinogen-3 oxidase